MTPDTDPGSARAAFFAPCEPGQPEPAAFDEPWQAQAFAMVLTLHQRGLFSWPEWAEALSAAIARAQAAGDPDHGDTYYRHWLAALEDLVARKGVATSEQLARTARAWDHAADRTPHGQPIELRPDDFDAAATDEGPGPR